MLLETMPNIRVGKPHHIVLWPQNVQGMHISNSSQHSPPHHTCDTSYASGWITYFQFLCTLPTSALRLPIIITFVSSYCMHGKNYWHLRNSDPITTSHSPLWDEKLGVAFIIRWSTYCMSCCSCIRAHSYSSYSRNNYNMSNNLWSKCMYKLTT